MTVKKQVLGKFIFDYLHKQGIDCAFGIPGDFVLPTFRHLDNSPIDIVTLTHEPSVGFAADCYARSKGLGLAVVTYCVGGLNMLNGIACAYAEKSPVIVISGGPSASDRDKDSMLHHKVKTFDTQRRIFEEITCANTILLDKETAAQEIVRVVNEVKKHSRPGYIEIPFDIVDEEIPVNSTLFKKQLVKKSDKETLKAILSELESKIENAKNPVIVADVELHRFGLTDYAAKIAKKFNIPVASTLIGKSVIRETNPLYLGIYSGMFSDENLKNYIAQSDCVMLLGAFMSDVLLGFDDNTFKRESMVLLSMEKKQIAHHSYDDIELEDVLSGILKLKVTPKEAFKNPNVIKFSEPLKKTEYKKKINVEKMFDILSANLHENDTVVSDTGDALIGAIGLKSGMRSHFFSDAYYLSMGFAAPAAIGAIKANKGSKTFAIIGDGAFQMTGMELSTAAKYKLDPVVIIINNDGYGTQRHIIDGSFNDINMWDYTKITDVIKYGKSAKVKTAGDFEKAIKKARKSKELFVIEVVVNKNDCSSSLRRMGEALGKLRNRDKQ